MANEQQALEIIKADGVMKRFNDNNPENLDYNREAGFAIQILTTGANSAKLMQCTKESIENAFYSVSAMGVTLNQVMKQVAFVPRGNVCVLELQYQGLITLMVKYGIVKRVIPPQIVYENDKFDYNMATNIITTHVSYKYNGADKPGEPIFVYCSGILPDGATHSAVIPMERIYQIRDGVQAYQAYKAGKLNEKYCLWVNEHKEEMYKKTAVKQLWKYLPKDVNAERVAEVMAIDNENEFGTEDVTAEVVIEGETQQIQTKEPSKAAATIKAAMVRPEQPKVEDFVPSNEMVEADIVPQPELFGEQEPDRAIYDEEELHAMGKDIKGLVEERGADIFLSRSESGHTMDQYVTAIIDQQKVNAEKK